MTKQPVQGAKPKPSLLRGPGLPKAQTTFSKEHSNFKITSSGNIGCLVSSGCSSGSCLISGDPSGEVLGGTNSFWVTSCVRSCS